MPSIMITSANRGLGLEFVRQYAADGWRIFAACRVPDAAHDLQKLARTPSVRVFPMDVTDLSSIRHAASGLNGESIDVLLNSAGVIGKPGQRVGNIDYESWAHVFNVNTMGALRVTEAFVEHVARSERKIVVTITSGLGSLTDNTSGGSIPYRTSKAAVNMAMRSAAIDLAPRGIACVLVNPGWVRTDMGGPGAPLKPAESVAALKRLIATFGLAHSGKFFHYDGCEYAW
ncbi:MAG TPA: SDR family oxidoreductase [Xanthobacteraceae bacterium]|nr:SDR family oxidoreductase [Xanthobacteraceae bacterium]